MSYPCGTVQANYFSNPDVMYLDKPTGTATENNARVIMENMVSGDRLEFEFRKRVDGRNPAAQRVYIV